MSPQLPPRVLVKTWLEIIKDDEAPLLIKQERIMVIMYHFESMESAYDYVKYNQSVYKRAS
jgi:hypothetical protein